MMENHTKAKAGRVCGVNAFMLLLVLFLAAKYDFYYDLNDDTMIKDILSGAYTGIPSGYCIQMLYPLAGGIALLYRAIPTVAWYGLFLCLCQFGVLALIAWRLVCMMQSTRTRVMALLLEGALALGLFQRELVFVQYSVTAAFCMAGAVFLFSTTPVTEKASVFFRRNIIPLCLVILSFMIRTEVCIMLLPFLLLAGLFRWCSEEKFFTVINIKKYVILIVMALFGMAAVYSLDMLAYKGSEWSNFRDFFDARTKIYDFYELPGYGDNTDFYESIGLSEESYGLLENYNFALDDSIDTWSLEAIADYQEQLAGKGNGLENTFGLISKNSIREAIWLYKNQLIHNISAVKNHLTGQSGGTESISWTVAMASGMVFMVYILYFVLCILPASGKVRVLAVLKLLCLVLIRSVLWLYLYMVDRALDRVTIPILMLELVTMIGFLISDNRIISLNTCRKKLPGTATYAGYGLCALCALILFVGNTQKVSQEYDSRAVADTHWNALMDYCRKNGNNYYVIDVYSSTSYQGVYYSEKMFQNVDNSRKNFDICGGWAAKSPLARQKLEKYHIKDIQGALCNGKGTVTKTYFVANEDRQPDWLIRYYEKRGIHIKPECIEKAGIFDIYELVKQPE